MVTTRGGHRERIGLKVYGREREGGMAGVDATEEMMEERVREREGGNSREFAWSL